jgi:hypothetical protein
MIMFAIFHILQPEPDGFLELLTSPPQSIDPRRMKIGVAIDFASDRYGDQDLCVWNITMERCADGASMAHIDCVVDHAALHWKQ